MLCYRAYNLTEHDVPPIRAVSVRVLPDSPPGGQVQVAFKLATVDIAEYMGRPNSDTSCTKLGDVSSVLVTHRRLDLGRALSRLEVSFSAGR